MNNQTITFERQENGSYLVGVNGNLIPCREIQIQDFQITNLDPRQRVFGVYADYTPRKGRSCLQSLCISSNTEAVVMNITKIEELKIVTDHRQEEEEEVGDVPQLLKNFFCDNANTFVGFKTELLIQELDHLSISFAKKNLKDIQGLLQSSKQGSNFKTLLKKTLNLQVKFPPSSADGSGVATSVAKAFLSLKIYQLQNLV